MASTPTYTGATKRVGQAQLNNASSTTTSAAILTGVAAGTRVREIRVHTGPTTAPGGTYKVAVIHDDGVTANVIDIVTLSNAVDTQQAVLRYDNLVLPGTGHSIKAAVRTQLTSGATVHVSVYGEDY